MLAVACKRRDLRQHTVRPPSLLALKAKKNPARAALHAPCRVPEKCRSKVKKPMCRQTLHARSKWRTKVRFILPSNRAPVVNVFCATTSVSPSFSTHPSTAFHSSQHHTLSGGPCISTGSALSRLHAGQRGVGVRQALTRFPASWPGKIAAFHSGPRHHHGRLSAVADAVKPLSI
jgi:hypothetical protein